MPTRSSACTKKALKKCLTENTTPTLVPEWIVVSCSLLWDYKGTRSYAFSKTTKSTQTGRLSNMVDRLYFPFTAAVMYIKAFMRPIVSPSLVSSQIPPPD